MRRASWATLVTALLLCLTVEAAPAAPVSAPHDALAAQKKKAKKCKQGKVRERVRKRTRCVPARKALPKPKAIDVPRAATGFVLGSDWSKLRDRRGKRLPSLPKLLRKVHPRAEQALMAATKAGLARAQVARASAAGCSGSGKVSSTFNAGGGLSVDVTSTLGSDASLQLGMESRNGDRRVRIEIEFPGCDEDGTQLDACPTADGIVRGRDSKRVSVRAIVIERGVETWSQGTTLQGETTFRGVVADDAKLDFMEPHNTEQATLTLGGSSRGFAPMTMRTLIQRITRVDMRTGEYVLGPSIVDVSIRSEGFEGAERAAAQADIARKMRAEADKQFRDIIDKAIRRYRETERRWNEPNTCATVEFTPASGTKTLHRGDQGTVAARTLAKPGGSPERAKWTLVNSTNAPFSPGTAETNPANFSHGAVAEAGPGITVTATVKSVSKAGVAQDTWTQPTEESSISSISGTYGGTYRLSESVFTWTGTATFSRIIPGRFQLSSGAYTVVASGKDPTTGCQQSGTRPITMLAGDFEVFGAAPPNEYRGSVIGVGPQPMTVSLSGCPSGSEMYEGQSITVGLPFTALDTLGNKQSADGLDFTGTASQPLGIVSTDWHWALRGTP
jgi:hypothetical protein